jgi:extracellular factor (EF) 3-hydroxypalmitic acid methyl ester biosynthesis protein
MSVSGAAHERVQRMRARRLRVEDLKLGIVEVACTHAELGAVQGVAEDISMHGLSFVLRSSAQPSRALLVGDRLTDVRVTCDAGVLYEGQSLVRRLSAREEDLVIGLELDYVGLDLARLYRSGARREFSRRWEAVVQRARYSGVSAEFKAWVAELGSMLVSAHTFLDAEERALASEDRRTRIEAEAEYLAVLGPDMLHLIEHAKQDLGRLVSGFNDAEHLEHRAYCKLHLGRFLTQSPFVRRALEKPLGYAGDYEMMNMLYRDPAEGESLFARALNLCFTQEQAAQANKNRISYLGKLIRKAIAEHEGHRIRIASLGCGPAREIEALLTQSPELGPRLDVALIDQEDRALAHCERAIAPLAGATGAHLQFIRERLRALIGQQSLMQALGERELIYSAGLFDYLDGRLFTRVASTLFDTLVPGGLLAIGNVAAHNPSRWVMEYFAEWFLIHRSADQLLELVQPLRARARHASVDAEPSGVNLFLLLRR